MATNLIILTFKLYLMKNFNLNHFSKFAERQEKKKKLQDVEDVQENINLNRQTNEKKSSSEPSMVKIDSWNENLNGWLFQCLFG